MIITKELREELVNLAAGSLKKHVSSLSSQQSSAILAGMDFYPLHPPPDFFVKKAEKTEQEIPYKFNLALFMILRCLSEEDYVYYKVLSKIATIWLESSLQTPKPINDWIIDVLKEEVKPPNRTKQRNAFKEIGIATVAYIIKERGVCWRRNQASNHRNSACDIVADAALKVGLKEVTYETVSKAVRNYSHLDVGE